MATDTWSSAALRLPMDQGKAQHWQHWHFRDFRSHLTPGLLMLFHPTAFGWGRRRKNRKAKSSQTRLLKMFKVALNLKILGCICDKTTRHDSFLTFGEYIVWTRIDQRIQVLFLFSAFCFLWLCWDFDLVSWHLLTVWQVEKVVCFE